MSRLSVGCLAAATRRAAVSVAAIALVFVGPVGASASDGRVVSQPYTTSVVVFFPFGGLGQDCTGNCLEAVAQPGEGHVAIAMHDVSGLPAYGVLHRRSSSGDFTAEYIFCGSTAVDVSEGDEVRVGAPIDVAGRHPVLPCGEPVMGTIVATFTG